MAFGEKLGKAFGAIGSGLSFIPGPWSALGIAFSAAGTAASAGAQAKQKREEERKQQELEQTPQTMPVQVDNQRPAQGQANEQKPAMAGPQSAKVFGQGNPRYNLGQMGENMDNSVMQMLVKESGGWFDG